MFECFEVENGRFVGFSYQPSNGKYLRIEGGKGPLKIDNVRDIKAMSMSELIQATDKIDYIRNGNPYFLIHSDEKMKSCDFVNCRAQVMFNAQGNLKCNNPFDVYHHAGEGKFWAVTSFQNTTYVLFKNDNTEWKWVFMSVNGERNALAKNKEQRGYSLIGIGHFNQNTWDIEVM